MWVCLVIGGKVRSQAAGAEAVRVRSELGQLHLTVFSPLPALAPLPQKGIVLDQEGLARVDSWCGSGCGLWQSTELLLVHCPLRCQKWPLLPHSGAI